MRIAKQYRMGGAILFLSGLLGSVYVFVIIQVLGSYPFRMGHPPAHQGTDRVFNSISLSYTQLLEIFVILSFVGFIIWKTRELNKRAIFSSLGQAMLTYGSIGAVVIYTETNILWGKIWHFWDYKFWSGFPGGGGYPWGMERVSYNTCFIKAANFSHDNPNCIFLNYDELLAICVLAVIAGLILWKRNSSKKRLMI